MQDIISASIVPPDGAVEIMVKVTNTHADVYEFRVGRDGLPEIRLVRQHQPINSALVTSGYVIVPKEPTADMIEAGGLGVFTSHSVAVGNNVAAALYRAMIEARPQ